MILFRKMTALILGMLLICTGCGLAEAAQSGDVALSEGEPFFGVYGDTPEEIILSAMEIFSWYTIWPLDVDPELCGGDGSVWRVADETLCSSEAMLNLLNRTFDEEIVSELLSYEVYTVINGALYTTAGGRPIDPNIAWVDYEESYSDENRVVYTVTVHYWGESEFGIEPDVLEFVREKAEDQWLFTQFPFFW